MRFGRNRQNELTTGRARQHLVAPRPNPPCAVRPGCPSPQASSISPPSTGSTAPGSVGSRAFTQRHPEAVAEAMSQLYQHLARLPEGKTARFYAQFREQMPNVAAGMVQGGFDEQLQEFIRQRMSYHDSIDTDFSRMTDLVGQLRGGRTDILHTADSLSSLSQSLDG